MCFFTKERQKWYCITIKFNKNYTVLYTVNDIMIIVSLSSFIKINVIKKISLFMKKIKFYLLQYFLILLRLVVMVFFKLKEKSLVYFIFSFIWFLQYSIFFLSIL